MVPMEDKSNWNIPNLLTISRILLTPVFIMAFVNGRMDLAWLIFLFAGVTDALDGFLARVFRQRTQLGAMLDPLADKILLVTSFICLAVKGWIPSWLSILAVSRDIIIVGGLAVLNFWGVDVKRRIRPTFVSKFNTAAQIGLIFMLMLEKTFGNGFDIWVDRLMFLVAGLTLISGIHYIVMGFCIFSDSDSCPS